MAVGMFILSQKQRQKLSIIFIILNIFQIIMGCGMTGSSLYIIIAVAPILHQEKSEINFVFAVTGLYGTHVMFHWIVGINISQRCLNSAGRKTTSSLFLLWSCLGTGTILQLLILSHFARKMNKYISRSIKQSIITGMNQYLQDLSWKEVIDKLQYSHECCGLISFQDWHDEKWLTKYHIDTKSTVIKQLRTNDEVLTLPVVPWSCCKVDFPMQCLHDPIQQTEFTHLWVAEPTFVTDSINTKGCLNILRKPITWTINAFVTVVSFLTIIHVLIFIVSRLLYTSSRNSILLGDPEEPAPGWIFGRGDCGYTGGKTVLEIMENYRINLRKHTKNDTEETDTSNKKSSFKIRFLKKKVKSKTLDESVKTDITTTNDADTILNISDSEDKTKGKDILKINKDPKVIENSTKTSKKEENARKVRPRKNAESKSVSNKILEADAKKKPNISNERTKMKTLIKNSKPDSNSKSARSMEEKLKELQQ
ncbi:peripherin-2-like [Diorhabda carinulata]|uniref:peripherin-2-like n=1 Tax=Diorhabda carinulata TaxID=1163345 RepID=UPI0025A2ED05|nr:peripherin-2-like [Diorhabda carinulata]